MPYKQSIILFCASILIVACNVATITKTGNSLKDQLTPLQLTSPDARIMRRYDVKHNLISETQYIAGQRNGPSIVYDKKGNIMMSLTYKDGLAHGDKITYSSDGTIQSKSRYVNGVPQGIILNFYPDGSLSRKVRVKDGLMDGNLHLYYPDGNIKLLAKFKAGKKNGKEVKLSPEGSVIYIFNFVNQIRHGDQKYYNKLGRLVRKDIYYHGELKDQILYKKADVQGEDKNINQTIFELLGITSSPEGVVDPEAENYRIKAKEKPEPSLLKENIAKLKSIEIEQVTSLWDDVFDRFQDTSADENNESKSAAVDVSADSAQQ